MEFVSRRNTRNVLARNVLAVKSNSKQVRYGNIALQYSLSISLIIRFDYFAHDWEYMWY